MELLERGAFLESLEGWLDAARHGRGEAIAARARVTGGNRSSCVRVCQR